MKINNSDQKLLTLYNENDSFYVPYYQRNYSWGKEQVNTLLNDIFFSKEKYKNKNNHFLGVVVSKEETNNDEIKYELIDGQQRLTTLSLFVKAVLNYIIENKLFLKDKTIKQLKKFLWKSNDEKRIRLQLDNAQIDNAVYNEIIRNGKVSSKKNLVFKAFNIIVEYLKDKQLNNIQLEEIISTFLNMQLVHIVLEKNEDNPQNVFESLNSKGLDLSNVDLIKNYLFMNILSKDRQTELYKNYWSPIEKNLKKDKYIEAFFRDLITLKTKKYIEKTKNWKNKWKIRKKKREMINLMKNIILNIFAQKLVILMVHLENMMNFIIK